jgi:hypothetical protein
LPHAVIATTFVVVLPAVLVSLLVPSGSLALLALSLLLGVTLSLAAASVGGAIWSRLPGSQDRVFADLMLWGWLRRSVAERRLAQAEKLLGADPQGASLEALIDLSDLLEARDARTYGHSQRVTRHAERIATAMGPPPPRSPRSHGRRAARHRQAAHAAQHPQQARAPDRQRVRADQAPSGRRRGDDERDRRPRDLRDDPPPPRAARRARLPGRAVGRGHPRRRAHHLRRRHVRRDHLQPHVPARLAPQARARRARAEAGKQLDGDAVAAFRGYYRGHRTVALSALVASAPQRLLTWLGGASPVIGRARRARPRC